MKTLIRILLVVSFAWLGLVAGALIAALWLVPKGAGLAGGAIVLGYAVLGALGMAVIGIVLAVKLAWRTLRVVAVIALTLTVLSGVVFAIRLIQRQSAVGDSDKDYAGLAHYTLRLENSESVEKSGFRTLDVDTRRRQGTSRAEHQRKTARALDNLSKLGDEVFTQCRETAAQADRVLIWSLGGIPETRLEVSPACMQSQPAVSQVITAAIWTHLRANMPLDCEGDGT